MPASRHDLPQLTEADPKDISTLSAGGVDTPTSPLQIACAVASSFVQVGVGD